MKKIYNYFINQDNHITNKNEIVDPNVTNSLKQGHLLLKNRRKFLYDLEYNLGHYNSNGIKEAQTGITDAKIIEDKIAEFTNKKQEYSTNLDAYSTEYTTFIINFNEFKKNVNTCKSACMETHNSSTAIQQQEGCIAGCHFKGPYIKGAEDTFVDTTDEAGNIKYSCSTTGETNCAGGVLNDGSDENLNTYVDANGTSIEKGCYVCGGGKFGPPKYVYNGGFIQNCDAFDGEGYIACTNAVVTDEVEIKKMVDKYASLSTKNQNLLTLADEILEIVTFLKKKNVNLIDDKTSLMEKYKDDASTYKSVQDEINMFTKKNNLTLNMLVSDSVLKKKAYDLRIYIWLILAMGLGFAALNKIRKF
jgi:hypothetical protein